MKLPDGNTFNNVNTQNMYGIIQSIKLRDGCAFNYVTSDYITVVCYRSSDCVVVAYAIMLYSIKCV